MFRRNNKTIYEIFTFLFMIYILNLFNIDIFVFKFFIYLFL